MSALLSPTPPGAYYEDELITLHHGKAEEVGKLLPPRSVQTIVTSPPYFGLRDYGDEGQTGAEASVGEYVDRLVQTFRVLRDALADDGTLWLNLGDSYASASASGTQGRDGMRNGRRFTANKITAKAGAVGAKNLIGVPWRVAFGLQEDGWILRSDIIWHKPNPMPESVTDRPTKSHEYMFLFAKSPSYYYDADAVAEDRSEDSLRDHARRKPSDRSNGAAPDRGPGDRGLRRNGEVLSEQRNRRTVWTVPTVPFPGSHFAVYPPELIRPCILAGSRRGDTVLDPFSGSGTTGMVATQEGRRYVGIELNSDYLDLSLRERFQNRVLDMTGGDAA